MSTFTSTNSTVRFTDTDGDVSFTATRPAVTFTPGYRSVPQSGGASDLDGLTDVAITAAASGDIIRRNGTEFVNTPGTSHFEAAGAVTSHNGSSSAHSALFDGKAAAGYTPALSLIVGTYLILGTDAVDGTATEMTLYQADGTVNNSVTLPDGVSAFGTFPLGDGSPGANWNFVFDQLGAPSIVVVIGSGQALDGVYRLTPGALDEPWEVLDCPIGTFAGFYISANVRLLISRTAYGWVTVDPVFGGSVKFAPATSSNWSTVPTTVGGALNTLASATVEPPTFWPPDHHTIATKVLRADFVATGPSYDVSNGAWETADPGVDITTAGLDIRAMIHIEHPINAGVGATGVTDTYFEVLTQEHPTAGGGDRFEAAIQWTNSSFSGMAPGRPYTFYEHLESGGSNEDSNSEDAWIAPYKWVCLRWTQDIANDTVKLWRAVPYKVSSTTVQTADDNIWWYPVFTETSSVAGSIDADDSLLWYIGKQATMSVAWLNARTYGNATANLVNVTAAGLDAKTVGDTSYTDTLGNVWTTTDGQITASPL